MNRIASRLGLKADRTEQFIALARAVIAWERFWPALWPASGILGLFAAAALFGLFAYLPGWLHFLILVTAMGATAVLLYRGFQDVGWPGWREGARRLERDSTLTHRPISEGDDTLTAGRGDPWAEALWRAHIKRLLNSIRHLHVAWPAPGLPERDPHALRFVVLLTVVAGFVSAGQDWNQRLTNAFLPAFGAGGAPVTLDAWLNPPSYTGEAPIYLEHGAKSDRPISVPAGSKLVVRVHGASGTPHLTVDPAPDAVPPFKGSDHEYATEIALKKSAEVTVRSGWHSLDRWQIRIIADTPPAITFSQPPSRTERDAVKFAFTAGDDYGIAKVRAIIRPLKAKGKMRKPLIVDLPVDNPNAKTVQQTVYKDLTEHPYAGLKVAITLEATDAAGQTGKSKPVQFTLPARVFTNPLARALVEQRQNLAVGENAAVPNAQRTLDALTIAPERFYAKQNGAYLAIRAAYWGLRTAHVADDLARVETLLWQTALALEQGELASAAQMLRRLQQMISKALATGAPQQKIDELMQRYKQALDKYLQSLAQNAQRSNQPLPPNARAINPQQLQDLLKAIQQLAQTGARQQASQMLSMLQNLLENMRVADSSSNGGRTPSPQDKAARDAIEKLGDLMGKQRSLLDKTYRQRQNAGNPKPGESKSLAQEQQKLREDLEKIMKGLSSQQMKAPKSLGNAGRAMNDAQGQLNQQDLGQAEGSQKGALEALRQGAGEIAKNLMQNSRQGQQGGNQDPFGRAQSGSGLEIGNVKVPDKSVLERARKILEELRARAAERGRPKEELDYIDRLLKQF